MVSYKGKIIAVQFYEYDYSQKPAKTVLIKEVVGKCTSVHTSQNIRDTSYIEVVDGFGNKHGQYCGIGKFVKILTTDAYRGTYWKVL